MVSGVESILKNGKRLPFWFGFRKNDGGEYLVEFLPNIHKIFSHIINYVLTSLVRSISSN